MRCASPYGIVIPSEELNAGDHEFGYNTLMGVTAVIGLVVVFAVAMVAFAAFKAMSAPAGPMYAGDHSETETDEPKTDEKE